MVILLLILTRIWHPRGCHSAGYNKKKAALGAASYMTWLRGQDLNLRPLGYEPNELPDCSTPRHLAAFAAEGNRRTGVGGCQAASCRRSGRGISSIRGPSGVPFSERGRKSPMFEIEQITAREILVQTNNQHEKSAALCAAL